MVCKKCGSDKRVKNGFIRELQRYKCKECGCVYTETLPRGKPAAMKALAVLLYTLGNASFGMIGRILGVTNVAVLKWVRKEALKLEKPKISEGNKIIAIDEMWHFLKKSPVKSGSGKFTVGTLDNSSTGSWVIATLPPSKNFRND